MTAARLKYLAAEIPRRSVRIFLCWIFNIDRWHILSCVNKPYALDIIDYLNRQTLDTVVEVGCGLCDILSHLRAPGRIGFDMDPNTVQAARIYNGLKFSRVRIKQLDFITDDIPAIKAGAWVFAGWLSWYEKEAICDKLRGVYGKLEPGGMMILDTINGPAIPYDHDFHGMFADLHCDFKIISQRRQSNGDRTVCCVVKIA